MCTKDQWPYIPDRLRDFIDKENLAALEAGLSEMMEKPVTLLDYDPPSGGFSRIESIRERQRYEPFCQLLRDESLVQGGDEACKDVGHHAGHQVSGTLSDHGRSPFASLPVTWACST